MKMMNLPQLNHHLPKSLNQGGANSFRPPASISLHQSLVQTVCCLSEAGYRPLQVRNPGTDIPRLHFESMQFENNMRRVRRR